MHYHTNDPINDTRYVHASTEELERYLAGTGDELMRIRECSDLTCVEEYEESQSTLGLD